MSTATQRAIVGVFSNQASAQEAIRELKRNGVSDSEIGVVSQNMSSATNSTLGTNMSGSSLNPGTTSDPDSVDGGSMATEGAAVGAATGAGVGALWALGIAAGVLPVIGPVIAGGLLAAVLASAAGGAATAGLIGALVGLGMSEDEARAYEGEVKSGRTLVTVRNASITTNVADILRRHGATIR